MSERPSAKDWSPEEAARAKARWLHKGTPEGLIENALRQLDKACRRAAEDLAEARQLLEEDHRA
jgi:hypothetical protein